jgi:hypothetical protein
MVENGKLLQIDCAEGKASTVGSGLTVIVMVLIEVAQPFAEAVIVKIVVCTTLVILVNVPLIEAVLPEAAIPVRLVVLVLVQLKVVSATEFVKIIGVIALFEQMV